MVKSHNILTVSYGTFSCTLEGFEDSFGTMKAIAQYFRDLTAGDRYFGGEPPTPDAEMLARIAERAIGPQIAARLDSSGIVPRRGLALNAGAASGAASEVETEVDVAAFATEVTSGPLESLVPWRVIAAETAPRAMPASLLVHATSESIAARLERIRAVMAHKPAPTEIGHEEDSAAAPGTSAPVLAHMACPVATDATRDSLIKDLVQAEVESRQLDATVGEFEHLAEDRGEAATADIAVLTAAKPADPLGVQSGAEPDGEKPRVGGITTSGGLSSEAEAALLAELAHLKMGGVESIDAAGGAPANESAKHDFEVTALSAALDVDSVPQSRFAGLESAQPKTKLIKTKAEIEAWAEDETIEERADEADHAHLHRQPDADAAAMDRLLRRAEAGIADQATKGRRNALVSLKAIFAATEAARRVGNIEKNAMEDKQPYRDDLRQMVRQRNSTIPIGVERAPLAPLRLAAAQRVDLLPMSDTPDAPSRLYRLDV